jgi:acyl-CoA thioester hydrolase
MKALLVFHDARLAYLEALGFSEADIGGVGIIMRDAHVVFRREVWLHDVLSCDVGIQNVKHTSFGMVYSVKREKDDEVVFTGRTGLVAFDYKARKPVAIPQTFLERITVSG